MPTKSNGDVFSSCQDPDGREVPLGSIEWSRAAVRLAAYPPLLGLLFAWIWVLQRIAASVWAYGTGSLIGSLTVFMVVACSVVAAHRFLERLSL